MATLVARQCVHVKAGGERCKRGAVIGTTVCPVHGGNAPQVKAAGAARLLDAQPGALDVIIELLKPIPTSAIPCGFCGRDMPRDEHLLAKVALAVCDRTGLGPTTKMEVETRNDDAWVEFCTPEQAEQLYSIMASARERMLDEISPASADEAEEAVH